EAHAVFDGARRVADLEAQIPQRIEHVFGDLLGVRGALVGHQEHQVDVRERGQLATPVAAGGGHRDLFATGRVGHRVDVLDGEVVKGADQAVHQLGDGGYRVVAVQLFAFEGGADVGAPR